jgi:hypothetical protein
MRALMIAAALAFTAAAPAVHAQSAVQNPSAAQSPSADQDQTPARTQSQLTREKAQCPGPDGKNATNSKCKGAGPAPAASAIFKLDDKGVCRDATGKAVKAANCKLPS